MSEPNPFGEWNLLEQVKFKECEIRTRNVETLRVAMTDRLQLFIATFPTRPWSEVRDLAVSILVESETCVDEYGELRRDLSMPIPLEESARVRDEILAQIAVVEAAVEQVRKSIRNIILANDALNESGDNP